MRDRPLHDEPGAPPELRSLPLAQAPDAIWASIEAALEVPARPVATRRRVIWIWPVAAAAAATLVAGGVVWHSRTLDRPGWEVAPVAGKPSVGSKPIRGEEKIHVGEWLQTDATSRAQIKIGDIGAVEVAPNTRLRLLSARPEEQRLDLARGEISASVSAPPRIFFVDTPSSTAVDLGCAYTLRADADGSGLLRVTLGWVSLEWKQRESLVPAGASCRTRAGVGPGTPFFDDASKRLDDALADFDFGSGGEIALETVLREARVRDTLTLWHLLSRVPPGERRRVFARMVELVPLPEGVSEDNALRLDPATLKHWREELAWKW